MEIKEFANLLNNREYKKEITKEEEKIAKENNLIVIFWYSDDNIELRWAINDEIWAYCWVEFYIDKKKNKIYNTTSRYIDERELNDEFEEIVQNYFDNNCIKVKARINQFWEIEINWIEYERFDINENWEKFSDWIILKIN